MRRIERKMSDEKSRKVLQTTEWGVLSLTDGNVAYGVPLNYVFDEEKNSIYFHAAKVGRKIDFIGKGFHSAFTVVVNHRILSKRYTAEYQSVISEGLVTIVTDDIEKKDALRKLCLKYAPDESNHEEEINKYWSGVAILKFEIDNISGKNNG